MPVYHDFRGCPRVVILILMDYGIVESEFEHRLRY